MHLEMAYFGRVTFLRHLGTVQLVDLGDMIERA